MACVTCRARKIKCDRTLPTCLNCQLRSIHCTYVGERRKRRWLNLGPVASRQVHLHNEPAPNRDAESTASNHRGMPTPSQPPDGSDSQPVIDSDNCLSETDGMTSTSSTYSRRLDLQEADAIRLTQSPSQADSRQILLPVHEEDENDFETDGLLLDKILDQGILETPSCTHMSVWMRTADGDEYTGPSSGISTISDMGLEWIRQHASNSDVLCSSILDIRNSVLGHLRQPKCVPPGDDSAPGAASQLNPIPHHEVARYVDAYFSMVQTLFPILNRTIFQAQLVKYGTNTTGTNHSWNALLNAVLASGCRAALSEETAEAFQVSGSESWNYFRNAIYYQSRMANNSSDLLAVQALTVMTVFAQGMSSPQRLEFTLSSAASRMAQSLALHQCPPREWGLSEDEQRERNRLFWTIYCLDKTIALRCGRPPILRDHEISCVFPHGEHMLFNTQHSVGLPNGVQNIDLLLCAVKLARICGLITDKLYSASRLHVPASELTETTKRILKILEAWRSSLPLHIRLGKPLGKLRELSHASQTQLLVLHSTYYYLLCAIYRRFTAIFSSDGKDCRRYISGCTEITHREAARSIILLTKFFDVESYTPGWLLFYYPFTALTTLFLHVVENPSDETVYEDIALMEAAVGFFGRLEYITSGEAAFTKTTEFVRQARTVIRNWSLDRGPQRHSNMEPTSNAHYGLFGEVIDERNTNSTASSSEMLPERRHADSIIPETGNSILKLLPVEQVPTRTPRQRAMDKDNGIEMPHDHSLPSLFISNPLASQTMHSDEMLDESWLEDWMISAENGSITS